MAGNARRQCWQRRQSRQPGLCKLQNLKELAEFESHPLRQTSRLESYVYIHELRPVCPSLNRVRRCHGRFAKVGLISQLVQGTHNASQPSHPLPSFFWRVTRWFPLSRTLRGRSACSQAKERAASHVPCCGECSPGTNSAGAIRSASFRRRGRWFNRRWRTRRGAGSLRQLEADPARTRPTAACWGAHEARSRSSSGLRAVQDSHLATDRYLTPDGRRASVTMSGCSTHGIG